jgi:hypothetical protein
VFLDLGHINYVPCHDMVTQIVFSENGGAVDSVMIGGRMVLDNGRLTTVDEKKLRRDAASAAKRLFAANAPTRSFAKDLQSIVGHFCHNLPANPIRFVGWDCLTNVEQVMVETCRPFDLDSQITARQSSCEEIVFIRSRVPESCIQLEEWYS